MVQEAKYGADSNNDRPLFPAIYSAGSNGLFVTNRQRGEKVSAIELTNREKQLLAFLRQLRSGEVKIRIENGQPVVIYEAINSRKLEDVHFSQDQAAGKRS